MDLDTSSSRVLYMPLRKKKKLPKLQKEDIEILKNQLYGHSGPWCPSHLIPYKETIVTMETWLTLRVPGGMDPPPTPKALFLFFLLTLKYLYFLFFFFWGVGIFRKAFDWQA